MTFQIDDVDSAVRGALDCFQTFERLAARDCYVDVGIVGPSPLVGKGPHDVRLRYPQTGRLGPERLNSPSPASTAALLPGVRLAARGWRPGCLC
jgi:hypothetical protein